MPRLARLLRFFTLLSLGAPQLAHAQPQVILFGGGWGPEGTQASIEAHTARLKAALRVDVLLFGAGRDSVRAVQVIQAPDPQTRLLGAIFGRQDHLQVTYRPSRLNGRRADKSALLEALKRALKHPRGATVFGAGHGTPARESTPAQLDLWGVDNKLSAQALASQLDAGAAGPLALMLGHCHSGAFTDIQYKGAQPRRGLAQPARCVFAAVPRDREAAGCTPDVNDPSAKAYLALVAEAFEQGIDLDGDRKTSMAEAHAHARLFDRTVNIPVSSSENWMLEKLGARAPDIRRLDLRAALRKARPTERAVVEQLQLRGRSLFPLGVRGVATLLDQHSAAIKALEAQLQTALDVQEKLRLKILDRVLHRWPELINPYHARARALLAGDAKEVLELIQRQPELERFLAQGQTIGALDRRMLSLQREEALLERWLRAVQQIANERALRSSGASGALDAILRCEGLIPRLRP